ncbi:hypothetical protein MTY66_46290 [Mycolicibacterium sp. TY66]|nr:hypothetical protein MTY66_46290 [Mycolicibacterium sp. TY66]BCJ79348.1 hypothetical protein MTY81_07210 [Mycolicibacterium sp. TY81]
MRESATEASQTRYANALTAWGAAGGYEIEVFWDVCTDAALGTKGASYVPGGGVCCVEPNRHNCYRFCRQQSTVAAAAYELRFEYPPASFIDCT